MLRRKFTFRSRCFRCFQVFWRFRRGCRRSNKWRKFWVILFLFFKMKKNITFINVQCFVVVLEMRLNIGLFEESESYFDIVLITANVFPDFEAFLQSLGCFEVLLLLNKESSEGVQWISNIGVHFSQLQFPIYKPLKNFYS